MEQIGYSLIDAAGAERQSWGDTPGVCPGVPDVVVLANGDRVHCPPVGETLAQGQRLVPRYFRYGPIDDIALEGNVVIVSRRVPREAIVKERERRLALGFEFNFPDDRGKHWIGTTEADMKGWEEVTTISQASIAVGQPAAQIGIVTDTGPVNLSATEWQQILLAAASFRQPVWAASFALQAMNPIPADYAHDRFWSVA